MLWTQLCCEKHLLKTPRTPGEAQDAVFLEFILFHFPNNNSNAMSVLSGVWTLEVPDHAMGRLFQRNPGVDGKAALYHAHAALLRTKFTKLPEPERDIYVEAPGGVFAGNIIHGVNDDDKSRQTYFRARTFLTTDQLGPGQEPLPPGTPSWGQTMMLPGPLLAEFRKKLDKEAEAEAALASTPLSA
jgi:hypothetical protein